MKYINLHAHSTFSDGSNSILDMAFKAKELDFAALVITDHDYKNSYFAASGYVEAIREKFPLPVILGCEIMTPLGEFLLYGKSAIRAWYQHKNHLEYIYHSFCIDEWCYFLKRYVLDGVILNPYLNTIDRIKQRNSALILPHPLSLAKYKNLPDSFFELLNGFEIQNGLNKFDEQDIRMVEFLKQRIPNCKTFRGSDAHSCNELTECYNEIDVEIKNEIDLINWIKG